MTEILHSAPIKKKITKELKASCVQLREKGVVPFLKVVLVGENPASVLYTNNKKKYCEKIGAKCDIVKLNADASESLFLNTINEINADSIVHGIIIQLPLPSHLQHLDVSKLVVQSKDVDGFHPENLYAVMSNKVTNKHFVSCTPKGILTLLKEYNVDLVGKNVVIIGRSMIVGKPLALLLTNQNATVTLCHTYTNKLSEITALADIIICAAGCSKFLSPKYLSEKRNQIVIDVGINSTCEGELCGDVDFDTVKDHVAKITPVPGGVGPLTIISLAQNLLQAAQNTVLK